MRSSNNKIVNRAIASIAITREHETRASAVAISRGTRINKCNNRSTQHKKSNTITQHHITRRSVAAMDNATARIPDQEQLQYPSI
eukprot:7197318-Lingulodinium_polyedra.AAC.1